MKVLCFSSTRGQDPSEVAVTCDCLSQAGIQVDFATEDGQVAEADQRMITGPVSVFLGATSTAKSLYTSLVQTDPWKNPHNWSSPSFPALLSTFDGVLLPGGHDKPMRQYLESESLQKLLAEYFPKTDRTVERPKVVGAICHGVLALARAKDAKGDSVLKGVQTTTLPVWMERFAYFSTAWALSDYYRTYKEYTADEVQSLLGSPSNYSSGALFNSKPFIVEDQKHYYVSGRFPGDAERFGKRMVELLKEANAGAKE
ncbi:class I glutamine amidotransferase-like protein [Meredithblackwellia eburnea MCA 4105]